MMCKSHALKKAKNIPLIPNQRSYLKLSVKLDYFIEELNKLGEVVDLMPAPHESICTLTTSARMNVDVWRHNIQ